MLGDAVAFSLMVGLGESFIAPFALALGFGDVAAGLIATAPMLLGAILQLVTPAAVGRLGSHKRWVVVCAVLQAMTFVPLLYGALAAQMSLVSLFATTALYWGLGMATGPAWNTWAGTLVPGRLRATYFARRSRWSNVALLGGLGLGALILWQSAGNGRSVEAYALLFACALLARLISAAFLARQSESQPVAIGETRISPSAIRAFDDDDVRAFDELQGFTLTSNLILDTSLRRSRATYSAQARWCRATMCSSTRPR